MQTLHPPLMSPALQRCHNERKSLTYVKDAVPRPTPPPALELLVLCVLQAAVVKDYTNYTLSKKDSSMNNVIQNSRSR